MFSPRIIIVVFLISLIVGCNRSDDPVQPSDTTVSPTATTKPTATFALAVSTPTTVSSTAAPTITPILDTEEVFDAAKVLGTLEIDVPVQPFHSTILALPPCRVENAPQTPTSGFLGTVPIPTPTPRPDSLPDVIVSADEIEVQRYIKTVYPSLATTLGWATAVVDVGIESLNNGEVLTLLYMESSRLEAVCKAVALISPTNAVETFHTDLFGVLLDRHAAFSDVRDKISSAEGDIDQTISALTQTLVALNQLDDDLEELARVSGLDYPPPLSGLVLSSTDLGLELLIPPGWQLTSVVGNLSLLAPPRMQGGGLQDVGAHFGANGSEFVYSNLRNPSDFDERAALDRVRRLFQPFGEFISETPTRVASLDGHMLEYVDQANDVTTSAWIVTTNGFSNIFRVQCPMDVIDSCVKDILPMLESAKLIE
jgi:hypothetical protein